MASSAERLADPPGVGRLYAKTVRAGEGAAPNRRYGRTEPRICTPPLRELTEETTLGYDCIRFAEQKLGVSLYPWQKALLLRILELDPALTVPTIWRRDPLDPVFRFRKVVILVARQNGKSTLSQVLSLYFMSELGSRLVLGTAQDIDTAKETWQGAVDLAQESELVGQIKGTPRTTNGQITLEFVSGERYKVKAANRRAGRGLSGDLVLLDELREHQTWDAWAAVTKTTQARPAAMIVALSNAGDATSVVLRYLRKKAHEALGDPDGIVAADDPEKMLPTADELAALKDLADEDGPDPDLEEDPDTLGLFEWSSAPTRAKEDRDGWAEANPSMGYGISERTIAGDCRDDPDPVFLVEVLCRWLDGALDGPFPQGQWEAGVDANSAIDEDSALFYALDVSADRSFSSIGVAGCRADGLPHVEAVASRAGTDWPVRWFAKRASPTTPITVAVQGRGAPVSSLIDDLNAVDGLTVLEVSGPDLGAATARMFDLVRETGPGKGLRHLPQPVLDVAAATAAVRVLGDGALVWDRRKSPVDISMLAAVTFALWALMGRSVAPARSVYDDGAELMFVD